MSFTQVLKSLTKIILPAILIFSLCACSQNPKPEFSSTPSGTIESISFCETDEQTNYFKLEMSTGDLILFEIYPDIAPETCANFKSLVAQKFYDGIIFHRVIENFMIQAGDPTGTGSGGSSTKIKGEFLINGFNNTLSHSRGVISMARLGDPYFNSASSQFFICHDDAFNLDGSYAAFGKVIAGMSTVDKIATVKTNASDRPTKNQTISSIRFITIE